MSHAGLDRLLAILLVAALVTGLATIRAGTPDTVWLYAIHGLVAGVLLAATLVKLRRSVPSAIGRPHWRRLSAAIPLAAVVLLSLTGAFAWVAGGRLVQIGPWTLLNWHVVLGVVAVPLVLVHLARGRWRILRPRPRPRSVRAATAPRRGVSRRALIAAGGLGLTGALIWASAGLLDLLSARPRRFTGSRWLEQGALPIPTTFFGESTDPIDPAFWRLAVHGRVSRPAALSLPQIERLGSEDLTAVLDCTGGWAAEATWTGVRLGRLLEHVGLQAGARRVDVRSVTGWGASFSIDEARQTLLATHLAGAPLAHGNGAPCRLVVPDRRGLDWVKWISQIEVS